MALNASFCEARFFVIFVTLKRQLNHEEHEESEEEQKLVSRMPITLWLSLKRYVRR